MEKRIVITGAIHQSLKEVCSKHSITMQRLVDLILRNELGKEMLQSDRIKLKEIRKGISDERD